MKRKLTWRGPFKYDRWAYLLEMHDTTAGDEIVATVEVEMIENSKGARETAKRIGDFLKAEAAE